MAGTARTRRKMPSPTSLSWLKFNKDREDRTALAVGGECIVCTAAAALVTGDAVFVSATLKVNKSATSANYAGFVGVVVGGDSTNMEAVYETGRAAASGDGKLVLVQITGVAKMMAEGTITAGTNFSVIISGSTAGKVIAGTTQGLMLGTPLTTSSTGNDVLVKLDHR